MPAIIPAVAAAVASDAAATLIGAELIPYAFAGTAAVIGGAAVGAVGSRAIDIIDRGLDELA